ncbi:hypothetical protein L2E82_50724 [Cichorium intybus]|nr:hypothetical protein L2E82_50724 [Cichorium intybus]
MLLNDCCNQDLQLVLLGSRFSASHGETESYRNCPSRPLLPLPSKVAYLKLPKVRDDQLIRGKNAIPLTLHLSCKFALPPNHPIFLISWNSSYLSFTAPKSHRRWIPWLLSLKLVGRHNHSF